MTYQVLARKWRPRSFQQMVGQEHILRMLTNALRTGRLHHGYLFTGTRGVGKTTLGRLLAKCLNCDNGVTPEPCDQCKNCLSLNEGRALDLIEVDAASRTKVEDTRDLLEHIHYPPAYSRFKIYLIDEVHMLSGHSFNALLKTLEEPPPHIKFLLATTDPKRLPITILSRCLQFNLKRVPTHQITAHLKFISEKENIFYEESALSLLAEAADGSIRDALSILDQAIAFCDTRITEEDVKQMLGTISHDVLFRLLEALHKNDGAQLLAEVALLAEHAANFTQVLDELLSLLHKISIAQIIEKTPENTPITHFAKQFSPEDIQLFYQIAQNGRRDLPYAIDTQQGFEMILIRMLAFQPRTNETSKILPTTKDKKLPPKIVASAPPSPPPLAENNTKAWSEILGKLKLTGMAYALASNCTLLTMTDASVSLALAVQHEPMFNKRLAERIEQALSEFLQKPMRLDIKITPAEEGETPLKKQKKEASKRQAEATAAIQNDDEVQKIMELFDATVDLNSIKVV